MDPEIEDVVQEDVGQERADDALNAKGNFYDLALPARTAAVAGHSRRRLGGEGDRVPDYDGFLPD
jgi:hypothetical protein